MSDTAPPIERTVTLATTVDDLPAAWQFVMARIDDLGPDPRITISPVWAYNVADLSSEQRPPRQFEVAVSGMIHVP
jgi:hypothetical protein